MITNNVATGLRTSLRRHAETVAEHATPKPSALAAKTLTGHVILKPSSRIANAFGDHMVPKPSMPPARVLPQALVPPESTWYKLKKQFINAVSNINYNKKEVHTVTAEMADKVLPRMKAGDILLRRTEGTSGNWFIPSWWKHAGVYVGDGTVVEATFKGIHTTPFKHFMTDGDHVMVVRAKNLMPKEREAIANYAKHQIGRPYDFDFNFVDEARQSCTELANHSVKAGAGKELVQKNWIGSVTGDAFKNENFKLIWSSNKDKARWG